jgi:hypothetical protein
MILRRGLLAAKQPKQMLMITSLAEACETRPALAYGGAAAQMTV